MFTLENHIVGKTYTLTQLNMNEMLHTIESLRRLNERLTNCIEGMYEDLAGEDI